MMDVSGADLAFIALMLAMGACAVAWAVVAGLEIIRDLLVTRWEMKMEERLRRTGKRPIKRRRQVW